MIGELATPLPTRVLPTTPVTEAARLMAEFGIGDVVVTDGDTGMVVGMLTDRDVAVRVVATGLDPALTPVGDVCSTSVTTIGATEDAATAEALMRDRSVRRLPIVGPDDDLVGIVSIEDLALSGDVTADDLREIIHVIAAAYRDRRFES
jgi:CBS domain-containing protein